MRLPVLALLAISLGCSSEEPPYTCPDGGDPTDFYRDDDGDGFGRDDRVRPACEAPEGFVATPGDCLDTDPTTFPAAPERCDEVDNDCNGEVDDAVVAPTTWFADSDGDGYGDPAVSTAQCPQPAGFVATAADCDDTDATIHPDAAETCDGVDDDCDLAIDEADAVDAPAWHPDGDGDGYGDAATAVYACDVPGWFADGTDCDDADPEIHPGAAETCDDVDRNCDGDAYAGAPDAREWYGDVDGDGYGGPTTVDACTAPPGYVADPGDCDDYAAAKHPGAADFCDTVDHDCDGDPAEPDSVDARTFYADLDGDGYGDAAAPASACAPGAGLVEDATDCDDGNATVHPGAEERCDGVDHDCDGAVDEADSVDAATWYADTDGDGFGDAAAPDVACAAPAGTVADACDCDDTDAAYNPDGLDCIAATCAGGAEVYVDDTCGLREVTADVAGTAAAPGWLSLSEPSTVTFCPGTHYLRVDAAADTTLVGAEGADVTTLDAALGAGITYAGSLTVQGLTLAEGAATSGGAAIDGVGDVALMDSVVVGGAVDGPSGAVIAVDGDLSLVDSEVSDSVVSYSVGSSVTCTFSVVSATGDVTLDGATFADNSLACAVSAGLYAASELRGSVLRVGGDLTASDSTLTTNTAEVSSGGMSAAMDGGVAAWVTGNAILTRTEVSGNRAEAALDCAWATCERAVSGAGLRVDGDATLVDSLVADNAAVASGTDGFGTATLRTEGGGLYVGGSFACTSSGGDHGFRGNSAGSGGGVYWAATDPAATFTSAGCDWGATSDNTPDDVAGLAAWSGGDDASFTCAFTGACTP